jgi:hypothetical protein
MVVVERDILVLVAQRRGRVQFRRLRSSSALVMGSPRSTVEGAECQSTEKGKDDEYKHGRVRLHRQDLRQVV